MKSLSSPTTLLINSLHERVAFAWLANRSPTIEAIGASAEVAAIPHLAPIVLAGTPVERATAARAVSTLLDKAMASDLPALDELIRRRFSYDQKCRGLERRDLGKLMGSVLPGEVVLKLCSMHPNGFVREEAVRRLALIRGGSELPFLLLRASDWVGPVNTIARVSVLDRIGPEFIDAFAHNFHLVFRLAHTRQGGQHDIREAIYSLFRSAAARPKLQAGINNADKIVRREFWRLLLSAEEGIDEVLGLGLNSIDPVIRIETISGISKSTSHSFRRQVLVRALEDPCYPVRKEALAIVAASPSEWGAAPLQSALFDRNAAVRAAARFHLGKAGVTGFDVIYRSALESGAIKALAPALAGLAETGNLADSELFLPYLHHPSTAVCKVAIKAVVALAEDKYLDQVLPLLSDKRPGTSNQARRALGCFSHRLDASVLWSLAQSAVCEHVWRNAALLIRILPRWEALPLILRIANDGNEARAELGRHLLDEWTAHPGVFPPSARQRQIVNAELEKGAGGISTKTLALLRFTLRTC